MSEFQRDPPRKESDTLVASSSAPSPPSSSSPSSVGIAPHLLAGRYEILGLIGVGGMGSVYRVRDLELEEVVALKVLRRDLNLTSEHLDGFRLEVKLARRVTHRNVARVFDIGEHEGEKFLTMELVDGEPLSAILARSGALPIARSMEIAAGIAAGLVGAHAVGVVHRDLKPDNVLIAKDGRVVVTDFGIARALADAGGTVGKGDLIGTPAYMAPEQVEGRKDIDGRADIYSLGTLLYEAFTGTRAWPGDSPFAVASARLVSAPPDPRQKRPSLPIPHAEFVMKCMARRREGRYATAQEVITEIERLSQPGAARRPAPTPTPQPGALASRMDQPAPSTREPTPSRGRPPSPSFSSLPTPDRASSPQLISSTSGEDQPPASLPPMSVSQISLSARPIEKTLAVLVFRNAGPPEDEYLADELTDDLIDSLSMTRGLKVRARGAVLRFKGATMDPIDIGRELGVQVIVDGSVRRANDNIRISARLISVSDGFQLWAKRFDRPTKDVLSINDDAAKAIADALTVDHEAQARAAPSDPGAIDLYLRARHEFRKVWPEHQMHALELFEQAATLAPGDPMILAAKAMALARRGFFTGERSERAREVAEQAVAVAPNLAESRLALGSVLLQCGDSVAAVREFRHAVVRGPGLSEAHGALGRLLAEVGALEEGIRRLEAAIALDPQAPIANTALARSYALLGDWARSDAVLERAAQTDGRNYYAQPRARFALWRRDGARAEALLREIADPSDQTGVTRTLLTMATSIGLPSERVTFPTAPEGDARSSAFMFQLEAEGRALVNDVDKAIAALRRSVDAGLIDLAWIDRCPLLSVVSQDPRFGPIRDQVFARAKLILEAYRAP